jgi:hypothetical protein
MAYIRGTGENGAMEFTWKGSDKSRKPTGSTKAIQTLVHEDNSFGTMD